MAVLRGVAVVVLAGLLAGCAQAPGADAPDPGQPLFERGPEADNETFGDPRTYLNHTTVSKRYAGVGVGPWAFNTGCEPEWDPGGPENLGGACIVLLNGTEAIDIMVTDDIAPAVGIYVRYDQGSSGFACSSLNTAPPQGATYVLVIIQELACALGQRPAASTMGEVKVTMYHP